MMRLLDTNTLSHLYAEHPRAVKRFSEMPHDELIGTTIITKIEMLRGRFDYALKAATAEELLKAYGMLVETEAHLADLYIAPFDQVAANHFRRLHKSHRRIGRADLLIACICLAQGAIVITRNVKDFRLVPNLRIENWLA